MNRQPNKNPTIRPDQSTGSGRNGSMNIAINIGIIKQSIGIEINNPITIKILLLNFDVSGFLFII